MPASELAGWQAFLKMYPAGEEALDIRFEALRLDLADLRNWLSHAIYRAAGSKSVKKPKRQKIGAFKIFNRFGGKAKKDFRDMTQDEIAARMRAYVKERHG